MEFSHLTLLVNLMALIRGEDESEGTRRDWGKPLKRQTPPCSSNLTLSLGQSSPLTTGSDYYLYSCTWRFTCPVDMNIRCSTVVIPCPSANFIIKGYSVCGSGILNPWNAGKDFTVQYYRYAQIGGIGFTCTVTCGSGSGGVQTTTRAPTTTKIVPTTTKIVPTTTKIVPTTTRAPTTTRTPTPSCTCGVSQVGQSGIVSGRKATNEEDDVDRIVGGIAVTDQRKYPWMAYFGGCGGALINDRYILTAAHCVVNGWTYSVTLGDLDKSSSTESRSITINSTGMVHPDYQARTSNNDIALLRLHTPVNFHAYPNIRPICLSSSAQPVAGQDVVIAGWGTTSFGGYVAEVMREAVVTVDNKTTCENAYNPLASTTGRNITGSMFCASAPGRDACQGDSGGPVMSRTQTGYFVEVGVVSWGFGCADRKFPGVYTRVANYVGNFIKDKTGDAKVCPPP